MPGTTPTFLPRSKFQLLLDILQDQGYRCIGPQVKDGAVVYDHIDSVTALPLGMEDAQGPGHYRVHDKQHQRLFAWANGPQALKPLVFAPRETVWRVIRDDNGKLQFTPVPAQAPKTAVIGVRACDLAALHIMDQHYMPDDHYRARREQLLLVAVNCTHPAQTCFCASTGDGPRAHDGFDLVLDELDDGYIVKAGSTAGEAVITRLPQQGVTADQHQAAQQASERAARSQTRSLPSRNLRDPLFNNLEHPRWDNVAARCLSCGNCTSVCPTCFCHSQGEETRLDGGGSEHYRQWDSCFTQGHSYIHGLVIRSETRTRYRQWLTHKLGSWHDQFGRSGCVGCGRCISWCPVGIDITEEAHEICGE